MGRSKGVMVVALRGTVAPAVWAILVMVSVLGMTACSAPPAVFVDEGNSYDAESVEEIQALAGTSPVEGQTVNEASDLRRESLIEIREQGAVGSDFAEFVTRTLPDNGRSVPYYGEAARFDGIEAWILLESWGSPGGTLDNSRIWVFDRDSGAILYSSAR